MTDSKTSVFRNVFLRVAFCCLSGVALFMVAGCTSKSEAERVPPPPSVTVVEAKQMTVPIVVNPIGTSRALEEVTIRARVRGFLTERHFEYGTNVNKGQLLLVIDEKPFQVALEQAKAQFAAAKASLEKAQASKAVEVAKANLALDQAQARLDEVEERRERILLARKAASQEDYDKASAQLKKSLAKVEADRANLDQTAADFKIDIASAQAEIARAQSAVDDAQINLGYCRMYAPIDGRIGELKVKVGNLVGDAGLTELVTIEQLDPMGLDLRPPARYLPEATALLGAGVTINLTIEGERRHPHAGKAIFIDNTVDEQTSTFLLRAQVPNASGTLLPGEYVRVTMTVGQYEGAVVVPEKAVLEGQEGTRVYVVDSQSKVGVAKVRTIDTYRGLRVIESGLEAGQRVIVEGVQLVRQGQSVAPVAAPLEQFLTEEAPPLPGDSGSIAASHEYLGEKPRTRAMRQARPVAQTAKPAPSSRNTADSDEQAPTTRQRAGRQAAEVRREMVNFFIGRPIFATVLALLMLLIGGICIFVLPIAQYPEITPPQVQVTTTFTGADAQTVAETVTKPIEQQVNGVKGMIYFNSDSTSNGTSNIIATFDVGYSQDIGAVDIQNRVQTAQAVLPAEVKQFGVTIKKTSTDMVCVVNLVSPDGRYDSTYLDNYAQIYALDVLRRIPGVSDVNAFGRKYAMRIWLEPDRLGRPVDRPD